MKQNEHEWGTGRRAPGTLGLDSADSSASSHFLLAASFDPQVQNRKPAMRSQLCELSLLFGVFTFLQLFIQSARFHSGRWLWLWLWLWLISPCLFSPNPSPQHLSASTPMLSWHTLGNRPHPPQGTHPFLSSSLT